MKESKKILFFSRTLELAKLGWGTTHPNPMVGALIVEDGEIVAEGAHHFAGGPHAEIEALKNLGRNPAPGASMFVSLEPCSTSGRTPPCTRAISEAGISKVYVASHTSPRGMGHRGYIGIILLGSATDGGNIC